MYKILEIRINGPFGSNYELLVDFTAKQASYTKQDAMFVDVENFNINLGDEELSKFIEKLDEYQILNWKNEYGDLSLSSGYRWKLKLVTSQTEKQVAGLVEVPEEWDRLLKQITLLLGKRFG